MSVTNTTGTAASAAAGLDDQPTIVHRDPDDGPPHVLILVQNLPVPLDRRVWLECRALRGAGYTVSVVCPKGDGDPAYEVIDDVHVYKYAPPPAASNPAGFAFEFSYCWAQSMRLALKVAQRERIDAIQACNPPDTFFALAAPFKGLTRGKTKFVFDQHDLCPEVYASRFAKPSRALLRTLLVLERSTYRLADHIIATNESFKRIAMSRGAKRSDEVTVVRSGPRANQFRRGDAQPELRNGRAHLCSYLGIMGPQDGVDLLVRVADELVNRRNRNDIQFSLMGFGDCFDELRALSTELGLDDHLTFTGRADDKMITAHLSTAVIGLSPDPKNEMNDLCTMNKTLEYMAFGLPVVSFDLAETRVSAGDAALYATPNQVESFADHVERLLDDADLRAEMGDRGRRRIEDSLSWEHSAKAYVGVYDALLRAGQR